MKMNVPLEYAYRLINHGPVVLVSTIYKGRANVCTASWVTPLDCAMVALVLSDENYSFKCVMGTGEFVLNIPPRSLIRAVVGCGSVSGAECDKFRAFGLTAVKARRVRAPLVWECIGHLECRVIREEIRLAKKYNLFLARVIAASAERGLFTTRWQMKKQGAITLHHLGGNVFAVPSAKELR